MAKKLDAFQLFEREGYLWAGSMIGLCIGFVMVAVVMLVVGVDVIQYPRLVLASLLNMVAISLVGRYVGLIRWRRSDEGMAALARGEQS